MSGIDGRDICKELKQRPATHKIPIFFTSASKDMESCAMAPGANDFFSKPFGLDDLLKKIE